MPERSPAQWDRLLPFVERRAFRAGEEVIRRGEIDRALYVVVDGSLEARTLARLRAAPEPTQRP